MTNVINLPTYEQVESVGEKVNIPYDFKVFKVGTSIFEKPQGVKTVFLSGSGAGGGGGSGGFSSGSIAYTRGGTSGGSGITFFRIPIDISDRETITVTIGAGGAGGYGVGSAGASGYLIGANGSNGGVTSFGDLLTISGGLGGKGGTAANSGNPVTVASSGYAVSISRSQSGVTNHTLIGVPEGGGLREGSFYCGKSSVTNSSTDAHIGAEVLNNIELYHFLSSFTSYSLYGKGGASSGGRTDAQTAPGSSGSDGLLIVEWGL